MSKYTNWFPFNVKPKRIGVYQIDVKVDNPGYLYWDGEFWYLWSYTIQGALFYFEQKMKVRNNESWRGLAQNPEETV